MQWVFPSPGSRVQYEYLISLNCYWESHKEHWKRAKRYFERSSFSLCKAGRHFKKSLRFLAPSSENLSQLFQIKILLNRKLILDTMINQGQDPLMLKWQALCKEEQFLNHQDFDSYSQVRLRFYFFLQRKIQIDFL